MKSSSQITTTVKAACTCTSDPIRPLQEICKEQYLFLLEFYIRYIQSSRLAKLNEMFLVPTTVAFRFLDFNADDDLQLTPVDPLFEPQAGIADDVESFYAGRSVLFALTHDDVCHASKGFKMNLCVLKKMPSEIRPDILIGKGTIDLSMQFAALRKEVIDNMRYADSAVQNPSKTFDDDICLSFNENAIGTMNVFARISFCGQTIVTEFEAPRDDTSSVTSFLFKTDDVNCEEKKLGYKCRILDPTRCDLSEILSATGSMDGKKDCLICKPPKMPCSPCRIPSGAKIADCPRSVGKGDPDTACIVDSCRPIQTSRGPKEPCGKAVVLKVSGLLDDPCDGKGREACVTVAPESEAAKPDDLRDPEHDVFILRIGKKGLVGAGEKSDIQLEMRTPKGPERRPPVRLETREMQTEDESGKKGAKGKKKKK